MTTPSFLASETERLAAWQRSILEEHDDRFEASKVLTDRLGAHWQGDHAEFGFWTPELVEMAVPEDRVYLELLTPANPPVDPAADAATVEFERHLLPTHREGAFTWVAVEGARAGTRDQLGSLYQLVYDPSDAESPDAVDPHAGYAPGDPDSGRQTVTDPLAYSMPFGAYAPPELYDWDRLDRERDDREYFQQLGTDEERVATEEDDGLPRIEPATGMLEIHPGTATEDGSLGGLARRYREIGEKLRDDEALTPAEENYVGYDAIQLMPVEPITENESSEGYFRPQDDLSVPGPNAVDSDAAGETVAIDVSHPDMINWGYDIVVSGFPAANPAILETGRPDELVDFIAACHALPDPIRVVFDIALGHADNGGLDLLTSHYFSGPGMYGQDLDYTQPVVRAVLLEMQKRKMDFGADGIRVDGAQDFTNWDPEAEAEWHDDAFLAEMDAVTQDVGGRTYRPWMIYEDGRPWPREDWELASTYRALIEQHPHSFQWSPITFAHNTPALLTFWATKWWRVFEVGDFGSNWITGVANHDTIRRGTQIDPYVEFNQSPVNPYLGDTYPDVLDNAYDNPAASMLFYCFLPGVPMDFLHANMRAPWGFIRDTDEPWNVKVVSDEANFIEWQMRDGDFEDPRFFSRLKDLGFERVEDVRTFIRALSAAVEATDYDLATMAEMLSALDSPLGDDLAAADLEAFGYAWMRDVHHFANVDYWHDEQDPERTGFQRRVREFRTDHQWLREDVAVEDDDHFDYWHPANGTILYHGLRTAPDGSEQLLFVANMEGIPLTITPSEDLPYEVPGDDWDLAIAAPGVEGDSVDDPVTLENNQAIVFERSLD